MAVDGTLLAGIERKSLENLAATLSDGTLAFQMQRLSELPLAAAVVELADSRRCAEEWTTGSCLRRSRRPKRRSRASMRT